MRLAIHWPSRPLAGVAVLLLSMAVSATAAASGGEVRQCSAVLKAGSGVSSPGARVPQVGHDARTNSTFALSLTREGAVRVTVKSGDLEVEKLVHADGHFRLTARGAGDSLSLEVEPDSVAVVRHGREVRLDPRRAMDDDWQQVTEMLAGSKAMRLLRNLAVNVESATLESPGGQAIIVGDAALGVLSGDVGAVSRVAGQMRAAHQRRLRLSRVSVAPQADFLVCYTKYADAVTEAADQYGSCRAETWWFDFYGYLCSFEWLLKAESIWFQFLGCSAFPIRLE